MTRQVEHATLFYRLSVKGKRATTLHPEEAVAVTSNLAPSSLDIAPNDIAKHHRKFSCRKSWKVSDDEYVIKVDASPIHMSAAQRLFGAKMQKKAEPSSEITEEDVDDFVAAIDDASVRRSVALRMFGGAVAQKNVEQEEEQDEEDLVATIDNAPLRRSVALRMFGGEVARKKVKNEEEQDTEDFIATIDDAPLVRRSVALRAFGGKVAQKKAKDEEVEDRQEEEEAREDANTCAEEVDFDSVDNARDLGQEYESSRNLGVEWTYFWNNVFHSHSSRNLA